MDPACRTHLHDTLMHDLNESLQSRLSCTSLAGLQLYKAITMLDEATTGLFETT